MVRCMDERKCDLIAALENKLNSSKVKNSALKQLKKFTPNPHKDLDQEFDVRDCNLKKYNQMQYFM